MSSIQLSHKDDKISTKQNTSHTKILNPIKAATEGQYTTPTPQDSRTTGPLTTSRVLHLQRTIGNHAVHKLISRKNTLQPTEDDKDVEQQPTSYNESPSTLMASHAKGCNCPGCCTQDLHTVTNITTKPPRAQSEDQLEQSRKSYTVLENTPVASFEQPPIQRNGDSDSESEYEMSENDTYQSNLCDTSGLLLPKYRGRIRRYFYPSGYQIGTHAWKESELKKIRQKTKTGKIRYRCPKCGDLKGKGSMTIDHKRPVSWHWNNHGYDQPQPQRRQWYNDTDNHKIICGGCNSSKGGESYSPSVGPNFLGPLDLENG